MAFKFSATNLAVLLALLGLKPADAAPFPVPENNAFLLDGRTNTNSVQVITAAQPYNSD